eukprot:m.96336 g.96336  ORF g.96336 m.96336 type:complete len:397 (+) comp8628_c0_seq3:139-1329(+)
MSCCAVLGAMIAVSAMAVAAAPPACEMGELLVPNVRDVVWAQEDWRRAVDMPFARVSLINPAVLEFRGQLVVFARLICRMETDFFFPSDGRCLAWNEIGQLAPTRCNLSSPIKMLSLNAVGRLDPNLQLHGCPTPCPPHSSALAPIPHDFRWADIAQRHPHRLGPEDPRAFVLSGAAYIVYNAPRVGPVPRAGRCSRCMYVQRVLPAPTAPVILRYPRSRLEEKNWAYLGSPNGSAHTLLFARYVDPHEVLSCVDGECALLHNTSAPTFFNNLKRQYGLKAVHLGTGSVPACTRPGLRIAVLHGLRFQRHKPDYYLNIPYLIEDAPPYQIVAVGSPLVFRARTGPGPRFTFVSSLARAGPRLVLGYTQGDANAAMRAVDEGELLLNMTWLAGAGPV